MNYMQLSKTVSHALRHEPWLYELELDDEGWTDTATLLAALRESRGEWALIDTSDLRTMISESSKQRHEINGNRIRAIYGHSLPVLLKRVPAEPPSILYHGTSPAAVEMIGADGLKPMGRQYVHLSVDTETAQQVGRRKTHTPIMLTIDSAEAHRNGVLFYEGNDKVWLADEVAPAFIRRS